MRGRQWLTLCSICFFDQTKMFLRMVSEEKVEIYRNLILEGDASATALAVIDRVYVAGLAATANGQVLPGVAIGNRC